MHDEKWRGIGGGVHWTLIGNFSRSKQQKQQQKRRECQMDSQVNFECNSSRFYVECMNWKTYIAIHSFSQSTFWLSNIEGPSINWDIWYAQAFSLSEAFYRDSQLHRALFHHFPDSMGMCVIYWLYICLICFNPSKLYDWCIWSQNMMVLQWHTLKSVTLTYKCHKTQSSAEGQQKKRREKL